MISNFSLPYKFIKVDDLIEIYRYENQHIQNLKNIENSYNYYKSWVIVNVKKTLP